MAGGRLPCRACATLLSGSSSWACCPACLPLEAPSRRSRRKLHRRLLAARRVEVAPGLLPKSCCHCNPGSCRQHRRHRPAAGAPSIMKVPVCMYSKYHALVVIRLDVKLTWSYARSIPVAVCSGSRRVPPAATPRHQLKEKSRKALEHVLVAPYHPIACIEGRQQRWRPAGRSTSIACSPASRFTMRRGRQRRPQYASPVSRSEETGRAATLGDQGGAPPPAAAARLPGTRSARHLSTTLPPVFRRSRLHRVAHCCAAPGGGPHCVRHPPRCRGRRGGHCGIAGASWGAGAAALA